MAHKMNVTLTLPLPKWMYKLAQPGLPFRVLGGHWTVDSDHGPMLFSPYGSAADIEQL